MADTPESHITGDDIISELLRNVSAGLFRVRYTVLVPCRFNVYLEEQDFRTIQSVAHVVRREAKQALTEYLQNLNRVRAQPKLVRRLGLAKSDRAPTYKILEPDWAIEFHQSEEDHLGPGEIEIYSDLGTESEVELASGAKTTFVTRHGANQSEGASPKDGSRSSPAPHATLRYSDSGGEKVFAMTRDEVVVGRGARAVWVDLKLDGPPDISREHCRIRRDAATGKFFIKDLSQYGTAVNGTTIPASIDRSGQAGTLDRNVEVPLPSRAKMTLADVLVIEFEARDPE